MRAGAPSGQPRGGELIIKIDGEVGRPAELFRNQAALYRAPKNNPCRGRPPRGAAPGGPAFRHLAHRCLASVIGTHFHRTPGSITALALAVCSQTSKLSWHPGA